MPRREGERHPWSGLPGPLSLFKVRACPDRGGASTCETRAGFESQRNGGHCESLSAGASTTQTRLAEVVNARYQAVHRQVQPPRQAKLEDWHSSHGQASQNEKISAISRDAVPVFPP